MRVYDKNGLLRYTVDRKNGVNNHRNAPSLGTGSNRGTSWVSQHTTHPTPNRGSNRGWDNSNIIDRGVHTAPSYKKPIVDDAPNDVFHDNMDSEKVKNWEDSQARKNWLDRINSQNQESQGSPSGSGSLSGSYVKFPDPYELDLSIFDQMMKTLGDNYNRSKGVLADQLKTALDSLASSRKRGNQNFHAGRATIAENSFDRQRAMLNDLASRGLAGSGLQQLGDVQEAMTKGREVSNLASKFYEFLDKMQESENKTRDAHNANLVNLENAYNSGLSNIGYQKWNAKNQYERDMMNRMDEMARFNARQNAVNQQAKEAGNSMFDNFNNMIKGLTDYGDVVDSASAQNMIDNLDTFLSDYDNLALFGDYNSNNPKYNLPGYKNALLKAIEETDKKNPFKPVNFDQFINY